MSTTTSAPLVIDALVALATTACPLATVFDGYPGTNNPPNMVAIGGEATPTEEGSDLPANLGPSYQIEEDYRVECVISCFTGGTVQKTSRDLAFGFLNAIDTAIRADSTLGNLVRFAWVDTWRLQQTDDSNAEDGRLAEVHFTVRCQNRI